jgi:Fe-S-cluster containining protein
LTEYEECEDCGGYCCASYGTPCSLGEDDVVRIAEGLEIPLARFKELYVVDIDMSEDKPYAFKQGRPCRFWTQGRCGIHAFKPDGCAKWKPYGTACRSLFLSRMEDEAVFPWWDALRAKADGGWVQYVKKEK